MGYAPPRLPRFKLPPGEAAPIIRRCEKCGEMLRIEVVKRDLDLSYNGSIMIKMKCPSRSIFQPLLNPLGHSEVHFDSYDGGATWMERDYVWR